MRGGIRTGALDGVLALPGNTPDKDGGHKK